MNVFFLLCDIQPVHGLHDVAAGGDPDPGPLSHKVPEALDIPHTILHMVTHCVLALTLYTTIHTHSPTSI